MTTEATQIERAQRRPSALARARSILSLILVAMVFATALAPTAAATTKDRPTGEAASSAVVVTPLKGHLLPSSATFDGVDVDNDLGRTLADTPADLVGITPCVDEDGRAVNDCVWVTEQPTETTLISQMITSDRCSSASDLCIAGYSLAARVEVDMEFGYEAGRAFTVKEAKFFFPETRAIGMRITSRLALIGSERVSTLDSRSEFAVLRETLNRRGVVVDSSFMSVLASTGADGSQAPSAGQSSCDWWEEQVDAWTYGPRKLADLSVMVSNAVLMGIVIKSGPKLGGPGLPAEGMVGAAAISLPELLTTAGYLRFVLNLEIEGVKKLCKLPSFLRSIAELVEGETAVGPDPRYKEDQSGGPANPLDDRGYSMGDDENEDEEEQDEDATKEEEPCCGDPIAMDIEHVRNRKGEVVAIKFTIYYSDGHVDTGTIPVRQ